MTLPEFKTLLTEFIERLADFEINFLFNKIDQSGRGKISKDMFVKWFGQSEEDVAFQANIEDILKPMVSVMRRKHFNVTDIFIKYDKDKSDSLQSHEIQ
mgnify:CR=1 FL=1